MDRENSFEDLEQFLTQLDWVPPQESTENPDSHLEPHCDPPLPLEQDEVHIQELEMRALTEHLKSIVKEIHVAIGERDTKGVFIKCRDACVLNFDLVCVFQSNFCHFACSPLRV